MRHDPASAAVVIMLRSLKMYGMAQAVTDLIEQGAPAFDAAVPILSQLLKAEMAEREVRSIAYQIDLPPSEWPRDYDSLDHERDDECQARSTSRKRLSASCVKLRLCWRRGHQLPKPVAGSRSASRLITVGARNMAA